MLQFHWHSSMSEIMSALERRSQCVSRSGWVGFFFCFWCCCWSWGAQRYYHWLTRPHLGRSAFFVIGCWPFLCRSTDRLRLLLIINGSGDRRSSSAANSPSDCELGQAAECSMGLGYAAFRCLLLGSRFSVLCFWGFIWEISFSLLFLLVICMRYLELL